jgi:hypothetical protein
MALKRFEIVKKILENWLGRTTPYRREFVCAHVGSDSMPVQPRPASPSTSARARMAPSTLQ